MNEEQDFTYDDEDAVQFIKNYLPQELKEKFSDDEINYIVDLIYDFYDSKGFMDENEDSTVDIDEDELIQYVVKNAKSDGIGNFSEDEITWIVQGELGYCESIHLFD